MVTRFRHDPQVRKDGKCVLCKTPREPNRSSKYGRAEAEIDPFCSTACARKWYGVPLDTSKLPSVKRPA